MEDLEFRVHAETGVDVLVSPGRELEQNEPCSLEVGVIQCWMKTFFCFGWNGFCKAPIKETGVSVDALCRPNGPELQEAQEEGIISGLVLKQLDKHVRNLCMLETSALLLLWL